MNEQQRKAIEMAFEKMTGVPDTWTNPALMQVRNGFISGWEAALAQPGQCQCPECQVLPHASDCAVHNEPAYSKGVCSCKAQQEQEPVATLWQHGETGRTRITMPGDITDCDARWFKAADLFTSPPAQRTWVGLTKEQK